MRRRRQARMKEKGFLAQVEAFRQEGETHKAEQKYAVSMPA